ncbi:MAG: right-handed parallel beta-helix repeat-containing protein [Pseudomonadota bacterium]
MLKHTLSAAGLATLLSAASGDAAVFSVDRTDDFAGASACTSAPLDCSLRGALQAVNISVGADEIVLPAGTFTLSQNTASADALAVGSEVTIRGSAIDQTFITADAGFPASAIVVNAGGALTLEDLTLIGFQPDPAESRAGALHITGAFGASAVLRRVGIENSRGQAGGGILVSRSEGGAEPEFRLRVFDSIISGNQAVGNLADQACAGGGVALLSGRASFQNVTITENRAELFALGGGGVCIDRAEQVTLDSSAISNNLAQFSGGGIHSEQSVLQINGTTIDANEIPGTQLGQGGALFLRGGNVVINDSELRNTVNQADLGTVIYGLDFLALQLSRSIVLDTNPLNNGTYFEATDLIEISDTTFTGSGSVIFARNAPMTLTRVAMSPFLSQSSALLVFDSTLFATDLVIDGVGTSGALRGAALQVDGSAVTVRGCEFRRHVVEVLSGSPESGVGGAVYASDSTLDMSDCSLHGNSAEVSGGAIALRDESNLTLSNSTLSNNFANGGEGLSVIGNSQATLQNVTFADPNGANQLEVFGASSTIGNSAIEGTCSLFSSGGDTDSLGNVVTDSSCRVQNAGDLVVPNLQLHPLADNGGGSPSHLPRLNSPLRDFAMNCPDEDQRGELRGEPCDAGAIERVIADNNLFMDSFEE